MHAAASNTVGNVDNVLFAVRLPENHPSGSQFDYDDPVRPCWCVWRYCGAVESATPAEVTTTTTAPCSTLSHRVEGTRALGNSHGRRRNDVAAAENESTHNSVISATYKLLLSTSVTFTYV